MSRLKPELHPLLTQSVIDDLFSKRIYTTLKFIKSEIRRICITTSLNYKSVLAIRNHFINKNSAVVQNGLNFYNEHIQKAALLSTGIKNVDDILQGGLLTGNIYEVCGLPASGKTQFCLTLVKNMVHQFDQHVYYLDTKGDFSTKKIKAMLELEQISQTGIGHIVSNKILVKQISTGYELINAIYAIKNEMCSQVNMRLIIIDSLPSLFYQIRDHQRNYGLMNKFVNIMHLLAREYHVAFVVTNSMTTWYEGTFGEDKPLTEKIGLGKYWFKIPNIRIVIKQTPESSCEFLVTKSCTFRKGQKCIVKICDLGMF